MNYSMYVHQNWYAKLLTLLLEHDDSSLTFLVLDFGLDILDAVRGFHFQGDGLSSQGFDKDLHTTTQTENEMEGRLLLNVVIREGATVLQLLASKDQPLLVRRDT